jgi:hypothetical protein
MRPIAIARGVSHARAAGLPRTRAIGTRPRNTERTRVRYPAPTLFIVRYILATEVVIEALSVRLWRQLTGGAPQIPHQRQDGAVQPER